MIYLIFVHVSKNRNSYLDAEKNRNDDSKLEKCKHLNKLNYLIYID